jgi:hypothetical protein
MKTIFWILFCSTLLVAQTDKLCEQRGHVRPDVTSVTDMYFPPRYVDLADRTLMITWDQNIVSYTCLRCGEEVREPVQEKPDTTIIWKGIEEYRDCERMLNVAEAEISRLKFEIEIKDWQIEELRKQLEENLEAFLKVQMLFDAYVKLTDKEGEK